MTAEQILVILFIICFAVGGALTCYISEKVKAIRERRMKKEEYISYLECRNLQLRRTVNFLKFQAELGYGKEGETDGGLHTVRE